MEQLVGVSWNEGNFSLFLVFPSPPLAMCMDRTFHKCTFTVEGNCFRVSWRVSGHQWWPNVAEYTVSVPLIFISFMLNWSSLYVVCEKKGTNEHGCQADGVLKLWLHDLNVTAVSSTDVHVYMNYRTQLWSMRCESASGSEEWYVSLYDCLWYLTSTICTMCTVCT